MLQGGEGSVRHWGGSGILRGGDVRLRYCPGLYWISLGGEDSLTAFSSLPIFSSVASFASSAGSTVIFVGFLLKHKHQAGSLNASRYGAKIVSDKMADEKGKYLLLALHYRLHYTYNKVKPLK